MFIMKFIVVLLVDFGIFYLFWNRFFEEIIVGNVEFLEYL